MVVSESFSDIAKLNLSEAVIVSPSDTVLGFHALYASPKAVAKIESLKNRKGNFIVLCLNMDEVLSLVEANAKQLSLMRTYWPGSVTFILKKKNSDETLAVRLSKNAYVLKMIQTFGGPIVSTSCNIHGEPVCATLEEAHRIFGDKVSLYLSFPQKAATKPSTIVDLTITPFKIIRNGEVEVRI